jgi:hypothetical protein
MKLPFLRERRSLRLVDHTLQQSLLVALVVMETALVAVAIWCLYQALGKIVDQNLYRVHFSGHVNVLALLVSEGTPVLAAMLGVNFLALLVADRIWAWYVDAILGELERLMAAARRLDFSAQSGGPLHHAVLEQAVAWRAHEAAWLAALRVRIDALPARLPADPRARAELAVALARLQDD